MCCNILQEIKITQVKLHLAWSRTGFVEIQKSESARGERSPACCCGETSWKLIVVHNKSERRFSLVNLLFQRVLPLKGISLFTGALSALCSRLTFSFVVDLQTCDVTRKLIPLGVLFSRISRQSCEVELKLVSKGKFLLFRQEDISHFSLPRSLWHGLRKPSRTVFQRHRRVEGFRKNKARTLGFVYDGAAPRVGDKIIKTRKGCCAPSGATHSTSSGERWKISCLKRAGFRQMTSSVKFNSIDLPSTVALEWQHGAGLGATFCLWRWND